MGTMSQVPVLESVQTLSRGLVGVDRDAKKLLGFIVAERGPFKSEGRGEFDTAGLQKIVELGNGWKMGLKSRFGHPGLSSDALATHLGRVHNFRMDGDSKVRADLHFADAAFNGPKGNLAGHVLDMAEQDPEAIGSSLVIQPKKEYRLEADGTRKKDAAGNPLPPLWIPEKLFASDIVEEGDATKSLLGTGIDLEQLEDSHIRQVWEILNTTFAGQDRLTVKARVEAFLGRYLDDRFGPYKPEAPASALDEPALALMKMKTRLHELRMYEPQPIIASRETLQRIGLRT